jgi:hypothetical protein
LSFFLKRMSLLMVETRWEVKIGSPVFAIHGQYGHLQQLLPDPHQERIVALLVQRPGLISADTAVVGENLIADATENEVRLKLSREQLDALPEYQPDSGLVVDGQIVEADDGLFVIREGQKIEIGYAPNSMEPGMIESQLTESEREHLWLRVRAGQQVFCQDEHTGQVSLILFNPQGRVKGFVLRAGNLPGRNLILPVAWVQEVDRENLHLFVEKRNLESLPDYGPDDALAAEVDMALWSDGILRDTDYKEIGVAVQDGIVRLLGHVITSINKERAE